MMAEEGLAIPGRAAFQAVTDWLDRCHAPLLVSHRRPDGDALGSLVGLGRLLERRGQEPLVTLFDPFPGRYDLLQPMIPWRRWDRESRRLRDECDSLIILDTCSYAQLEPIENFVPHAPPTLVIDHHISRDEIGTRPADLRLIDERAAATTQVIADWAAAARQVLDPESATALFTGLATDTGWFKFSNADPRALRVAADLLEYEIDAGAIYDAIYQRDPLPKVRLIGRLLSNLELQAGGRLVVLKVRQSDFAAVGADVSMTEDLINEASRLVGSEATIMFTEVEAGQVRLNFRSKRALDVAALARHFGGGGHARAAGARPAGSWDEIVPAVVAEATRRLSAGSE